MCQCRMYVCICGMCVHAHICMDVCESCVGCCVHMLACGVCAHPRMCYSVYAEVIGQSQVLVLAFHLIWDRVSLSFPALHVRQAGLHGGSSAFASHFFVGVLGLQTQAIASEFVWLLGI